MQLRIVAPGELHLHTTKYAGESMSMRAAINAHCKWCIYDKCAPGTWRQQVQNCAISTCSLWVYRPRSLSRGKGSLVQDAAVLNESPAADRESEAGVAQRGSQSVCDLSLNCMSSVLDRQIA